MGEGYRIIADAQEEYYRTAVCVNILKARMKC